MSREHTPHNNNNNNPTLTSKSNANSTPTHAATPTPTPLFSNPRPSPSYSPPPPPTDHDKNAEFPSRSSSLNPAGEEVRGRSGVEDKEGDGAGAGESRMEEAKERIEDFDYEGLERRFWERMEECGRVEEGVRGEFGELVEVFNAWVAAGLVGEEERAAKRLRTRMAFVQQREESLENTRLHYVKVVKAFESALALLSGPP